MSEELPRHTSTRTSIEKLQRRVCDQAAEELVSYLERLPECGFTTTAVDPDRSATRERIQQLQVAVERYLGVARAT